MHSNPLVAIVLLNFNGRHHLQQFLPSVLASTYINKKIIVADNGSTDDSLEWLRLNHPAVEVIALHKNYGFAQGYNEALKQVVADYFVLLNTDVQVDPAWIEPVIELFETNNDLAAAQPKVLSFTQPDHFEYAGAGGGWLDSLGYPFSRGRVFDVCEKDVGQYDAVGKIFWASGCALFVRAPVFSQLKGFDGYFFAHQEEIDLCWRMQLAGYTIMACPSSKVYHVGGGTLPKGERKAFLNFRNNLVMVYKNWGTLEKVWKLPLRIVLDLVSACQAWKSGNPEFAKGVIKAEVAFIKWLFTSKRENVFPEERRGKLDGLYRGSVVLDYFIKKKKTFSEIVFKRP